MSIEASRILAKCIKWLPEQGPLEEFVHHNTLHAFEDLPFEMATELFSETMGCEPYMAHGEYISRLKRGLIDPEDLQEALRAETLLNPKLQETLKQLPSELSNSFLIYFLNHKKPNYTLDQVNWLAAKDGYDQDPLWNTLMFHRLDSIPPAKSLQVNSQILFRKRDLMARLAGAFLDQGISSWKLPDRQQGFWHSSQRLCAKDQFLPKRFRLVRDRDTLKMFQDSKSSADFVQTWLESHDLDEDTSVSVLNQLLHPVRGWAGTFATFEHRKFSTLYFHLPISLMDFVAVWIAIVSRPDLLKVRTAKPFNPGPSVLETYEAIQSLSKEAWVANNPDPFLSLSQTFDDVTRRRIMHLALERTYRKEVSNAVSFSHAHPPAKRPHPSFQAMFCIDEREESFRRALEELCPDCETFGVAGFFEMDMLFKAADSNLPRPLCPPALKPSTYIIEENLHSHGSFAQGLNTWFQTHTQSALLSLPAIFLLGWTKSLTLLLRQLWPKPMAQIEEALFPHDLPTKLISKRANETKDGLPVGYTKEQMSQKVASLIRTIGMEQFSNAIFIVGHGSSSMNNPHEAAHDCGACAGGRGAPNARLMAQFANDPDVRASLTKEGIQIPKTTIFVGAYHNTCDDTVTIYDEDLSEKPENMPALRELFEKTSAQNAHERSRRFRHDHDSSTKKAYRHMLNRALMLDEPRPEYGHATNSLCLVGTRDWSRNLFLDRRAFLVSYRKDLDGDGAILKKLLSAIVPVCAGINLEYYFSFVDNEFHGCGTKLPHNVSGNIGVQNGFSSDLRTGLPWQMVEIHEPVRLYMIVEASNETIQSVLSELPAVEQLVKNRWLYFGAIQKDSTIAWYENGEFVPGHTSTTLKSAQNSKSHYQNETDHLPLVTLGGESA